jgi:NADH-quinone oxidoreductase subunit N
MPEVYLCVLFLLVLITGLVYTKNAAAMCRISCCAGDGLCDIAGCMQYYDFKVDQIRPLFNGMLLLHAYAVVFKLIIDVISILLLFYFAWDKQLKAHKKGLSDLYAIT